MRRTRKKTARRASRKPAPRKKSRKPAPRKTARRTRARRRGLMLVLSSPSGAGKTTLSRMLLEDEKSRVELSVSVTTRTKRASEIEGRHYHFIDAEKFRELVKRGDLLEWAEVHGNYYGTPRAPVERHLRQGRDVLFDIDWQGTLQLYGAARPDVVSVFVLPPTVQELRARLARRAEDNQEIIQQRLRNAVEELDHWKDYEYVVVNEDLDRSFRALKSILTAERLRRGAPKGKMAGSGAADADRLRRDSQRGLANLVRELQVGLARL